MGILIFACGCMAYNGLYLVHLIRKGSVRGAIGICMLMAAAASLMILNITAR